MPLSNYYHRAEFLRSVAKPSQLPDDSGYEVAFAGRSNAGKSSAINVLTNNLQLARTSKTPGRTQLINFFTLDEERRLVDLPGYGYAKVPHEVKEQWGSLLDDYLRRRDSLVGMILLMDCRHPMKAFDRQIIQWCADANIRLHILLTKSDKLKRGPASSALLTVQKELNSIFPDASVQLFSSLNKSGTDQLISVLDDWMNIEQRGS